MNPRPRPTRAPATGECIDPFDIVTRNMAPTTEQLSRALVLDIEALRDLPAPVCLPGLMKLSIRLKDGDDPQAVASDLDRIILDALRDLARALVEMHVGDTTSTDLQVDRCQRETDAQEQADPHA